jgi:pimeloyl-ACP methyl ester carboxylesterase
MDRALLHSVSWIGQPYVQGPIRGIVLRMTALGASINWKSEPEPLELEWAGHGALVVKPYHDPWAWMNLRTRNFLDQFVPDLRREYGLGPRIPLILVGGSMGGHGVLMYAIHSPFPIAGCLALFPPADLVHHYAANEGLPRTYHHAFDCYGDIKEQLAAHSPLQQAHRLPDVPYLIVHGPLDKDVPMGPHSDKLVAAMRQRGLRVEYRQPPTLGHNTAWDWVTYRRLVDFVAELMPG